MLREGVQTMIKVGFKRLTDDAVLPIKAHARDSGFDLFVSEDIVIEPGETVVIATGIAIDIPIGYEAQVRPRSGVTSKTRSEERRVGKECGYREAKEEYE